MRVIDMAVAASGYVCLCNICTSYRIELATGLGQEWPDYAAVPVGAGTGYFLLPHATVCAEQTGVALVRVTRYLNGFVIEIPESIDFRPEPLDRGEALLPIVNERHCMEANGISLR